MSIKKENLNFFNKKGDNLNLYFDSRTGLYRGNYVLSEQPISVGLIESEQIIILEKVFSQEFNKFMYVKPTSIEQSSIVFEIDKDSEEFFTFDISLDIDNNYYINKANKQSLDAITSTQFYDETIDGTVYTKIPQTFDITQLQEDYNTINIGFSSNEENSYVGKINIFLQDTTKQKIGEIYLFIDVIAEDVRLPLLLDTLGFNIDNKDYLIFDNSNVKEEEIDYVLLNKKRKELLLEFHNIFPYLGSYKALINVIKFFGYESLSLKEYWKNVKVDSENFGKLRPVDVESVLLNSNNISELSDLFPSKIYKKTNMFGLYYQLTEETGEYDEDGLPIIKDTFQFSIDEILLKLYALKDKLKNYFLPLNSKIVDIVGEALYFTKIELNYWMSFNRVDSLDININPQFDVYPSNYGFISDLRPLEWIGAKIGPDLTLDGVSNLKVREIELSNSFYKNKLSILDTVSNTGASIIVDYQSSDIQNIRKLYNELLKLGKPFSDYYITVDTNKILFVEKYETDSNIVPSFELGQFASTNPIFTYTDYFNSNQPVSNYGNAYLDFFFDRKFNVRNLNNDENIPVGFPIILKNTSFDISWNDLQITYNCIDEKHNYNDFDFSTDTGFPTMFYDNGNDFSSGLSWDNIGNLNYYEIEWKITKEQTETPAFEISNRGTILDLNEYPLILPYSGKYTVNMTIYDLTGSYSTKTKTDFITVEQKNPNFTAWKFMDLTDLKWNDLTEITWNNLNSTWDLPFLPNTNIDDALINWYSIDNVEFYQNLIKQNTVAKSKGDINSLNWKNLDDDIEWGEMEHQWWDNLSPTFTKFYISELQNNSTFGLTIKDSNNNILETVTFDRNYIISDDNIYIDFIDQISDLDSNIFPYLSSFIYSYSPIVTYNQDTIHQIIAISKGYEKPKRFLFEGISCNVSNSNTPLNGFGALGDSPAFFEIYSSVNIQNRTNTTDSSITIGNVKYQIPDTVETLSDLANDLNTVKPFPDWEFNLVSSYQGPDNDYEDEKIIGYTKYNSGDEYHISYENVFGNKFARSITTNATWDSLEVIYYQSNIKPYTQVYFNYDISKMPGFKNPKWIISKVGTNNTNNIIFTWLNRYLVYLFTEQGEYNISLELEDTNGNKKTIQKNGLIRVI